MANLLDMWESLTESPALRKLADACDTQGNDEVIEAAQEVRRQVEAIKARMHPECVKKGISTFCDTCLELAVAIMVAESGFQALAGEREEARSLGFIAAATFMQVQQNRAEAQEAREWQANAL